LQRISFRLLAFGVIMSLLPLSLLALFGLQTARTNLDRTLSYHHSLSLARTVGDVTAILSEVERSLNVLATLETAQLSGYAVADSEVSLRGTLSRLPQVEYLAIFDENGREAVRASKGRVTMRREICPLALEAYLDHRAYIGAVHHLSDPYDPIFNITVPLPPQEDGRKSGGLSATVSMKAIIDQIYSIPANESVRIFLVDGDGLLIGHRSYDPNMDVTASLPPGWLEDGLPLGSQPVTRTYTSYTGERVIGAHAPVPNTNWLVIAEQPVSVAYAPYRRVALTYGMGVGTLIVLVLSISLYVGVRFGRDLKSVENGVRRVASGELGHQLPVRGDDELSSVVRAVNQLSTELLAKREIEAAVRKADRQVAVGLLAAGVAHEVNNPLAAVSVLVEDLLERLQQGETPSADMVESLRLMRDQVGRCSETTRTLLDFARQNTAAEELVQVGDLLNATLALLRHQLRKQHVALQLSVAPDLPPLLVDKPGLQQVVLNLAANAIDAMPDGGVLSVTGTVTDQACIITIADTGCGIASEDLDRVFDPFYTTKPLGRGTGLGLPVCKEIIQRTGGTLQIMSTPGAGTTVTITIPLQEGDA
jgi:two-component system, NtrC family, sensor kinase